ncbi:MAG: 30S ribosomal protein S9 [Candidatus Magasanikbacteria bacterium GW2011_GWC2_37_14]|uniref:Small ribosomal subunit protein uS9 n=1 Tax=Candidatus Magasanikbacteria bacterium GW2011_GWC2_37_14 TaxID=1619046 RepID=A0A0G0GPS5_9BACT|nr:MAG: 30S ribosomal protein S9 [Candidatus Magasanikbacteria bacterium GW2011_GWC2_37_14]
MVVGKKVDNSIIRALGRRKTSAARVRIQLGKGEIVVNEKPLEKYFPLKLWQNTVLAPLVLVGKEKSLDVSVRVVGGGVNSQAGAVCHGIARALLKWNEELKPVLKAEGFLTRDSRAKERKKFGRHKARRGHQWRKR